MKDNLINPCAECPFRKNSLQGWLGGITPEDTVNGVLHGEIDFACHMTRDKPLNEMSRCRGSLLFLKQACKLPRQNTGLIQALSKINFKDIGNNILSSIEFLKHHTFYAKKNSRRNCSSNSRTKTGKRKVT